MKRILKQECPKYCAWRKEACIVARTIILLGFVLISGCTTTGYPRHETDKFFLDSKKLDSEEAQNARKKEWVTRQNKETKQAEEPQIGLALAGGGTRAAQYAVGVLEGLQKSDVLKRVDVISSVSGGSYAAYGYFSRLLEQPNDTGKVRKELFEDCIPLAYKSILGNKKSSTLVCANNNANVISDIPGKKYHDPYRWQNNLRGRTDIFNPEFNYETKSEDTRFLGTALSILLPQALSAIVIEPITDFAFDWNLNTEIPHASSRRVYREGIGKIWGLPPVDCGARINKKAVTQVGECWIYRPFDESGEPDITFEQLRDAYNRDDNDIPFWIINATTPVLNCEGTWYEDPICTVNEWSTYDTYPPHKAGFEITPFHWGSGEHGYWHSCLYEDCRDQDKSLDTHGFGVLGAVSASAAFFDPYEKTISDNLAITNLVQQWLGLKWGYYIPNPVVQNESPWERYVHRLLPFPIYLAHGYQEKRNAMDIHLLDGGQNENLGAAALIRRRIPSIIISDHASEKPWGGMKDICNLKKWLRDDKFAEDTGKIWLIHIDALPDLDGVCKSDNQQYNLYTWKNPVLKGCAVELVKSEYNKFIEAKTCDIWEKEKGNHSGETRQFLNLYVLKPAIDLNEWTNKLGCINRGGQDFDDCLNNGRDSGQETAGNAEILGFLMKKSEGGGLGDPGTDEGITFPRHHTVSLTIDSSPWLFGAYRELGALAASKLTLGDDGSLKLPTNKDEKPSQCVACSIKKLSEDFQEKVDEFCKNKTSNEPLCDR